MYLLYLDESGDPNSWQGQRNYALGGVAIHEGQVWRISNELEGIQNRYFPNITFPIGFHASEIRRGKGHFEDFTPQIREQILNDVYNIFQTFSFPNLIAFAVDMDISAVQNLVQVRSVTLEDVCARFNTFLVRQFNAGYPNKGLLIIDRTRESQYRELIDNFKRNGIKSGYMGNIVDIPYFARCYETRMLQLADFCANAVFQYYERGEQKYLNAIMPRFDRRSINHPPDGLKHITKSACRCPACTWR